MSRNLSQQTAIANNHGSIKTKAGMRTGLPQMKKKKNNQLSSSTTNITSTSSNLDYESVINTTTKIQTIEHKIQINI